MSTSGGDVIAADALTPGRIQPNPWVRTLLRLAPLLLFIVFALWLGASQANNAKWLDLAIEFMYIAAAAMGVNILLGYTGLLSLGHYGFFVAGGYSGAILTPYLLNASWIPDFVRHNSPWFGFVVAFVTGALLGALLALMCCHLRGFYLTVVTLAFGTILPAVVGVYSKQLGGSGGRQVERFPDTSNAFLARNNARAGIYYVATIFLLVTLLLTWSLVRSRWGRALMAIRESELAARTNGVNTYWYKVASFAVSAGIVGVAGWVGALRFLSVSAGSAGDVTSASFRYVVIIVLGGIGTLAGPIVGAVGITFGFGLSYVQNHFRDYQGLLFGALGLFGVATAPEGLIGNLRKAVRDAQLRRVRKGGAGAGRPPLQVDEALTIPMPRTGGAHGSAPVLVVDGLTKRFGGLAALSKLDLTVARGSIHALIGPNGSGKSTFVNVITGLYDATEGAIEFNGIRLNDLAPYKRNRIGVARTFQNLQVWRRMGVLENVMVGAHSQSSAGLPSSLLGLSFREERRLRERAWGLLHFVGLADRGWDSAGALPFADQRRLEIARALASDPDLLLLDEPAAGMHPSELSDLVALIRKVSDAGVTVLLIEHHMDLVMGLSDVVSVLDYGEKIAEGTPAEVRNDPRVIEAYLGTEAIAVTGAASEPILRVVDLSVFYGAAKALSGISFEVFEGEVVTIIGGNGAGKSTTLKTVSGVSELLKSVQGEITFAGSRVEKTPAHRIAAMGMAHVPEGRRVFPQSSVEENLLLGAYRRRRDRQGFQAQLDEIYDRFPVLRDRRRQPAGYLSGGEQQMLAIGRGVMSKPRFLLLDEPSLGLAPLLIAEVFGIIQSLAAEGTTILLVEQMANKALEVADRAYVLETGVITTHGAASDLAKDPRVRAAYLGA